MRLQSQKSNSGNLREAVSGINNPDLLVMISNKSQFEQHVKELAELYPNVPSIATTGHFYDSQVKEGGVGIAAFFGVKAEAGVLRYVSTMPVADIAGLKDCVRKVGAGASDTVCINLCAGNDACVLTTMDSVLGPAHISLTGGTAFDGMVALNGTVYEDASAYALVKNVGGRIKVYKENIYRPSETDKTSYIASKTDRDNYYVGELNGKPAKQVYMDALHIPESKIETQTFQNPFGKITGDDICIISLKGVKGSGLCCYRQVNDSDVLTLLEIKDYRGVVNETIQNIKHDFNKVSGVFSINCVFRYLFFNDNHYTAEYLREMATLGPHCGFFANGEECNAQFVNQSMSCVVFG